MGFILHLFTCTNVEAVPLIVAGLFKFYFPIDFIGGEVSRGSVGGQLTGVRVLSKPTFNNKTKVLLIILLMLFWIVMHVFKPNSH